MEKNEIQDKIKEAHATADRLLTQAELSSKWNKVKVYMGETVGVATRWHVLAVIVVVVLAFWSPFSSAACSMKTDSWGNSKYTCHDGNSGTLVTDSWGTTRDSRTGTRYKTDSWGTTRFNDGTTSKTDAWGNTRYSNGTVCKTDSWGTTRCN